MTVIVPHLNQPEALTRCLAALEAGTRRADEVIVVDNGSTEPPAQVCAANPRTRLLAESTPGPGPARNRGAAAAGGDILAFIDADCRAGEDWLRAIAEAFRDPQAQILGGDVRIDMADPARPTIWEAYEAIYAYRMARYIRREGFTGTGNLAMRRTVFDAVGPFGGIEIAEDRDWGKRAAAQGYCARYVAGMRVYHPARESFAQLAQKWDRHIAHDAARDAAAGRSHARRAARAFAVAVSPVAEIGRVLTSPRIRGPRARLLAWLGLVRVRLYRARRMLRLLAAGGATASAAHWNRSDGPGGG
ncbi:glycosyl transferase family 2 [Rhodobacteraceae bacterium WD3A24]|nr:glycosyl transferase family 2 [Rhodobacteraceae bacterium WD3A24]